MPCYDPRGSTQTETVYRSGISPSDMQKVKDVNAELLNKNKWIEGAMCAIFNELDSRGIAGSVVAEASRNGLIGLMDFWNRHKADDESRIATILHSFSKDEQAIMKKLLK